MSNHLPPPGGAREQFAARLRSVLEELGGPTLDQIVRASQGTPAPLNKSSVSEWKRGRSLPETPKLLESLLRTLDQLAGVRGIMDRETWQQAYVAAQSEDSRRPVGGLLKVKEAEPLALGVHRAHTSPTAAHIPSYIPRDVDTRVRSAVRLLLKEGGMLLLTGDSTAGKSRTAYEAMAAVAPERFLVDPGSNARLVESIASALDLASRGQPCLLWLNDAERFLGPRGLEMADFRRLRSARIPIIATMRDSFLARLTKERVSTDILNLVQEIHLNRLWSRDELTRARKRLEENGDPRVAEALRHSAEHGISEYLAAGPRLWRELQQAPRIHGNPRGAALVHAAIDLARAGFSGAITTEALIGLHEHHLPGANKALLTPEPIHSALAWATEPRYGVTRHLVPVDGGWQAFDYLVDTTLRQDRPQPVSDHTWEAALDLAAEEHQRFDVAFAAFANERPDVGSRVLLPLAEDGSVLAMRALGALHRRIAPQRAKDWLKRAIAAGDVVSMRLLGNQHVLQNRWDKGVKWYRRAAKAGDPESEAFFRVPTVYPQDEGSKPCPTAALLAGDPYDDYEEGEAASPWSPTLRTLKVLEAALDICCDMTYDAIEDLGGRAIKPKRSDYPLDRLPSQTWRQSRKWRRRFARCHDDLANDIRAGGLPRPRCTGEEMALHLALESASAMTCDEEELVTEFTTGVPRSRNDFDWDECHALLFEDHDVLWLYEPWMSGIEDPDNPTNRFIGVAHLRPDDWFKPFRKDDARDPARGHRR
ncbi:hypothetical protein ACIQKB_29610 [Streptomyces sp. NPDC092046]|uniref:hypothetical protein n=1 Tax=Streptomyces sp. NPDC092046 TaxID=3366009 RepID=UPI00380EE154